MMDEFMKPAPIALNQDRPVCTDEGIMPAATDAPRSILILEDDPFCAKLLQKYVTDEWPDCAARLVANKADFEAALNGQCFDLILSDYFMPAFTGLLALKCVRNRFPKLPFIFVSGAMGEEIGVESLKLGATDYLSKSRLTRLVPAIKRALDEVKKNHERELAVEKLEQLNRRFEILVNSVDGIVWQADQETLEFKFVSRCAQDLLGYSAGTWLEKKDFWQEHIYPEDRNKILHQYRELTPADARRQFEYRMLAHDGRLVWMRDNVSLTVQNGGLRQLQGIMVDVTGYKNAEIEIQAIQAKLQESNNDLRQKHEEIQSFYHTLSHELKTPLTSAREFVSLVMEGLAGPLNATQMEYLAISKKSCDQLRVCINDLIDATRIETGKMSVELKPGSLTLLIQRLVTSLRLQAAEKNVMLESNISEDLSEIIMDECRIAQTITNLSNNAINHTPPGGKIRVSACAVPGRPDFIKISVRDNGCGISQDEQERIFNRLYQIKTGDATTKGIGLGLYLCKQFVQLHGGKIWVESELGKGSDFIFILPRDQFSFRPNVLVVDDDPDVLEMARNALFEDYNVRCAMDGENGLAELRHQLPDVVLLDLSMPNMCGVALLEEIRTKWDSIPVILHTAYSNGELMKRAMEFSPFTILSKPNSVHQLRETVQNNLRSVKTSIWTRNLSLTDSVIVK